MGTSSIYGGPNGGSPKDNPLLPDDFNLGDGDGPEQGEEEGEDTSKPISDRDVSWKDAKTYMSKLASRTYTNTGKAVSKHVRAYGGSRAASKTAAAGISTAIGLGSFVSLANSEGIKAIFQEYKIEYQDKSPKEVLNELINVLAPVPVTKDDAVARKAVIITLEFLYELFEQENIDYDSIEVEAFNIIVPKFIENYIYERILNDLGSRIELYSENAEEALQREVELKEYINAKVDIAFKGISFEQVNFNDNSTPEEVEKLFNQCYTLMEEE